MNNNYNSLISAVLIALILIPVALSLYFKEPESVEDDEFDGR